METLKENLPAGEREKELVEFDATPKEEFEKMAKNLMTAEEQGELQNGELELIRRIARTKIERMDVPPSIHDAIAEATIIRLGVREFSRTLVVGPDGQIIASGASRIDALYKAQGEKAE